MSQPQASYAGEAYLAPVLLVSEYYSSNAGNDPSGNKTEDQVTSVAPSLTATYKTVSTDLNVSYGVTATLHYDNSRFNTLSQTGSLGIKTALSERTAAQASGAISFTHDSLSADDTTGIQVGRTNILTNSYMLGLSHSLSEKDLLALSMINSSVEYAKQGLIDTRTYSANAVYTHTISEETTVSLGYTYSLFNFRSTSNSSIDTHALRLGLTKAFSPRLTTSLSAGVNYSPLLDNDSLDYNADASLAYKLKRISMGASYTRSINASSGLLDELSQTESYHATASVTTTKNTALFLSGNYSTNRSKPSSSLDTTSYSTGISGEWKPRYWLSTSIGYTYFNQNSESATAVDIDSETIFVNITLTPRPWRL